MNSNKNLKHFFALGLIAILSINSGCYMHTFYDVNNKEIKNFKINKAIQNDYRLLINLENEHINNKYTNIYEGTIAVYPEYTIEAEYELKKTMGANFSEGTGNGLIHGIGLLLEIAFNSLLIFGFGYKFQDDINNKREINYFTTALFFAGIFNVLYDFTAYKVKEYNLTNKTEKYKDKILLYTSKCDSYSSIDKLGYYIDTFKKSDDKYNIALNNKILTDSVIEFGFKDDKERISIKTDSAGKFISNRSIINLVLSKCLPVYKITSNTEIKEQVQLTYPLIISNNSIH